MGIRLVRVDERLIHGQILQSWLPFLEINKVVVVDNETQKNPLQKKIIESFSLGTGISVITEDIEGFRNMYRTGYFEASDWLIIFSKLSDVKKLCDEGYVFPVINIGNVHYCENRAKVTDAVYLSAEEKEIIASLRAKGIQVSLKCVPTDKDVNI